MDAAKIKNIQKMITNHQDAVSRRGGPSPPAPRPSGAGLDRDDLSKVMTNDVIGKGSFDPTEALKK